MKYVRRFEDGRCCQLVINPDRVILSMFPAGSFECPDPVRFSSLPALLERLSEVSVLHPDLQDFAEVVWLRIARDKLEEELIAAPRKTEKVVGGILYRKTEEDNWRTAVAGAFSLATSSIAECLATEELRALFPTALDYEEID